jgi:hypothetical protein
LGLKGKIPDATTVSGVDLIPLHNTSTNFTPTAAYDDSIPRPRATASISYGTLIVRMRMRIVRMTRIMRMIISKAGGEYSKMIIFHCIMHLKHIES